VADDSHDAFCKQFHGEKGCVRCCSYFFARVRGGVLAHFQAVAVHRHTSERKWVFGLPGRILCDQSPWCQRKW
jgi:hypothetical protein